MFPNTRENELPFSCNQCSFLSYIYLLLRYIGFLISSISCITRTMMMSGGEGGGEFFWLHMNWLVGFYHYHYLYQLYNQYMGERGAREYLLMFRLANGVMQSDKMDFKWFLRLSGFFFCFGHYFKTGFRSS
ncbi:hypothetical protein F4775DRAFT_563723 [Biscogniauxia sp. FL1348]|nr:hypothetical protein F4775DRAFT_563723 [Biscogniauxia sp. FL1348]